MKVTLPSYVTIPLKHALSDKMLKFNSKAQVSSEYILIIAAALLLVILVVLFLRSGVLTTQLSSASNASSKLKNITNTNVS